MATVTNSFILFLSDSFTGFAASENTFGEWKNFFMSIWWYLVTGESNLLKFGIWTRKYHVLQFFWDPRTFLIIVFPAVDLKKHSPSSQKKTFLANEIDCEMASSEKERCSNTLNFFHCMIDSFWNEDGIGIRGNLNADW